MNDVSSKHADAFGDRMLDLLNNSMLSLMIGIGHQTELFDDMLKSYFEENGADLNHNQGWIDTNIVEA